MSIEIQIGNTNIARLTGVKNGLTGLVDDGATIEFTLYEVDGVTEVTGQSWPANMFNEPGGTYIATLNETLDLLLNHTYTAQVDGVGSGSEVLSITEKVKAKVRGSDC